MLWPSPARHNPAQDVSAKRHRSCGRSGPRHAGQAGDPGRGLSRGERRRPRRRHLNCRGSLPIGSVPTWTILSLKMGASEGTDTVDARFWLIQTFNGVSYGALLFLVGSGLSLIFGVMRIVNLSHGAYFLLGGYIALSVIWATGSWAAGAAGSGAAVAVLGLFDGARVSAAAWVRSAAAGLADGGFCLSCFSRRRSTSGPATTSTLIRRRY